MTHNKRAPILITALLVLVLSLAAGLVYLYMEGQSQLAGSPSTSKPTPPPAVQPRVEAPRQAPSQPAVEPAPRPSFLSNATQETTTNATKPVLTNNATASPLNSNATATPAFRANATILPTVNATNSTASALPTTLSTNGTQPNAHKQGSSTEAATNAAATEGGTILFSKGKPLDKNNNIVGGPAITTLSRSGSSAKSGYQDNIINRLFITSLGEALAASYWPKGTHPGAMHQGISTFSLKWANIHYGNKLTGFNVTHTPVEKGRRQVLQYVLMASMVKKLYDTYADTFMDAVEARAAKLERGKPARHLTNDELAEMYAIFTSRSRGLAGALQAYAGAPGLSAQLQALHEAENAALDANHRLIEASDSELGEQTPDAAVTREFQDAIRKRETIYNEIVVTMRQGGTRSLDADTLVYIASWLYRRGNAATPAIEQFALCLENLAQRFEMAELRHQETSAVEGPDITTASSRE